MSKEGVLLERLITSLEEIIIKDEIPRIKEEIRDFVLGLLLDDGTQFDVVIGVDRKGLRILKEVIAGYDGTIACKIMSDNQIEPGDLKGARVLVFDDSIHTGKKVLKILDRIGRLGPKNVTVACLLANEGGKRQIEGKHKDVGLRSCAYRRTLPRTG